MSLSSENVHPGGRSDGRAAREMCLFAEVVQLDEFKKSLPGQVTTHLMEREVRLHADDGDCVPAAASGQRSGAEKGKDVSNDAGNRASARETEGLLAAADRTSRREEPNLLSRIFIESGDERMTLAGNRKYGNRDDRMEKCRLFTPLGILCCSFSSLNLI